MFEIELHGPRSDPHSLGLMIHLGGIAYLLACDLQRHCCQVDDVGFWIVTDFWMFPLYLGPVCLYCLLRHDAYENSIMLSLTIYILCPPVLFRTCNASAQSLITCFVHKLYTLHGALNIVFNVFLDPSSGGSSASWSTGFIVVLFVWN